MLKSILSVFSGALGMILKVMLVIVLCFIVLPFLLFDGTKLVKIIQNTKLFVGYFLNIFGAKRRRQLEALFP